MNGRVRLGLVVLGLLATILLVATALLVQNGELWVPLHSGGEQSSVSSDRWTPWARADARLHVPQAEGQDRQHVTNSTGVASGVPARSDHALAELRVRVVDDRGDPEAAFWLYVETVDSGASKVGCTDGAGRWTISGLEPGRVAVRGLTSGEASLTLGKGVNEVLLQVGRAADLLVEVVDEVGAPVAQALVHLADARVSAVSASVGSTDEWGRFTVRAIEDSRSVFVTKPGFEPSPTLPLLPEFLRQSRTIKFQMARGGCAVRGKLTEEISGMPVAGALVRLRSPRNQVIREGDDRPAMTLQPAGVRLTETDPAGRFEFLGCGSPPWRVEVSSKLHATERVLVQETQEPGPVGQACEFEVPVRLHPAHELRGLVVDAHGVPVRDAVVVVRPVLETRTTEGESTRSSEDGSFRFTSLKSGSHLVECASSRGRRVEASVLLPTASDVLLALPDSVDPTGTLVGPHDEPLPRWNVGWSDQPLGGARGSFPRVGAVTDGRGRFWSSEGEIRPTWWYAWPQSGASMPVLAVEDTLERPLVLRTSFTSEDLGSLELLPAEMDRSTHLYVDLAGADSNMSALSYIDAKLGVRFWGLRPGIYDIKFQLEGDAWRAGGQIEIPRGTGRTLSVPLTHVLRALPESN